MFPCGATVKPSLAEQRLAGNRGATLIYFGATRLLRTPANRCGADSKIIPAGRNTEPSRET
ncbi:hypothetical protein NDK47_15975 [Brevibacillus ruminantium]|uniref:Uncharacterized protein n=1 Tax=Brevibacillus ruminantium TaxID=2950604 RepID=A0ABY4WG86_9BACL|nr:hypothetical protein [Brevibacillus ruminantium]USG63671.1 hypothetical protein NDK47_15975 [Brevibacillus ruminantium]